MKRLGSLVVVLMLAACSGDSEETENQEAVTSEENTQEVADQETDTDEEETSTESESTEKNVESDNTNEEADDEVTEGDENTENEESEAVEQVEEEPTESETETEVEVNNGEIAETPEFTAREFSDEEKQAMNDEFYNWAVERAEIGAIAVTDYYFGHGAAGRGDWYALTPDGEVLVQDQNNPGFDAFDIHTIGGVVFYQPISGDYGADENTEVESTATGYQTMALDGTDIHKYMLADNGVVYEYISPKEVTTLHTGFGEYDDDGTPGQYGPGAPFEISADQDAQNEWQRILSEYQ